jgi:hypothetical protein
VRARPYSGRPVSDTRGHDQYYVDNGRYPADLNDLINTGTVEKLFARDTQRPFTGSADWITVAAKEKRVVFDAQRKSLLALDGTAYNAW